MTTNHDHEIKFKRLNNLKDPAANRTWLTNIINICRSRKVHELTAEHGGEERKVRREGARLGVRQHLGCVAPYPHLPVPH